MTRFSLSSIKFLFQQKKEFYFLISRILGYQPRNFSLYELAFVHRSMNDLVHDRKGEDNERLEFLGDAVLDTVVADYLYAHYPSRDEGFLTKMRSKLVNREFMNDLATQMGIDELIIAQFGRNTNRRNLYGNALEALIGAVFIDKGYKGARKFIIQRILRNYVCLATLEATESNYKSSLIEWGQKEKAEVVFDTTEESNVPSIFKSVVKIDNQLLGEGKGYSKKEAEQLAAESALKRIRC
ncbi:MAG: ribonuclease III [Marinilabiliales bacterium]|nr:MAG: ribonuclease III [Marinilabiliales bacterium]